MMDDFDEDAPYIDLSQDIIGWDESRNVDLRSIAKSPQPATPTTANTKSAQRSNGSLDDVRRKLDGDGDGDSDAPTPRSLQTQPPLSGAKRKREHDPAVEQEINGIFNLLQKEEALIDGLTPASALTQKSTNTRRPKVQVDDSNTITSLAQRHRRRRRNPRYNAMSEENNATNSPSTQKRSVSSSTPEQKSDVDDEQSAFDAGGVFDHLLEQLLSKPQEPKRPPLQNMTNQRSDQTKASEAKEMKKTRTSTIPNPETDDGTGRSTPLGDPIHNNNEPLTAAVQQQQQQQQQQQHQGIGKTPETYDSKLPAKNQQQQCHKNPYDHPLVPSRPTGDKFVNESQVMAVTNTLQTTNQAQHLACSVVSSKTPPDSKEGYNSAQPEEQCRKVENAATGVPESDQDEFGDLDLSFEDMASLDALLLAKSSQEVLPMVIKQNSCDKAPVDSKPTDRKQQSSSPSNYNATTTNNCPTTADDNRNKEENPTTSIATAPAAAAPEAPAPVLSDRIQTHDATATVAKAPEADESEDEFGDFPDVDFEAIDRVIASRTSLQGGINKENVCNAQAGVMEKPPIQFPVNQIVKNPRCASLDGNGNCIRFSRYRVISVTENMSTYTKTLAVAAWSDSMLKDIKKEKQIHKNCEVDKSELPTTGSNIKPNIRYPVDGSIHLRGEWYHTRVDPGDFVHVCSISGTFRTDKNALPLLLHTNPPPGSDNDDLVLVMHPDLLMIPTTVSEAVTCSRRAVLKSRIGSTGISAPAPLIGTMRHELFEHCIKEGNFDMSSVGRKVQKIVRQNAESIISAGITSSHAESEVMSILPTVKRFVSEYTTFGKDSTQRPASGGKVIEGQPYQPSLRFLANAVHSVEEPVVSHELALKGVVDAILHTTSETIHANFSLFDRQSPAGTRQSLMGLELKTGHNQKTQHAHTAQLSLYSVMLQARYGISLGSGKAHSEGAEEGAASGGLLLYLNHRGLQSAHVAPRPAEIKSLFGQRNVAATEIARSNRPRGIVLSYEKEKGEDKLQSVSLHPPPPAELPEVLGNTGPCTRCYMNRECMLYSAAETKSNTADPNLRPRQTDLLLKFTGHLKDDDFAYFQKWDRLIDLEADASFRNTCTSWLVDSQRLEQDTGESISDLRYGGAQPAPWDGGVFIAFDRPGKTLEGLAISHGTYVSISTDGNSFSETPRTKSAGIPKRITNFRHQFNVIRGVVEKVNGMRLYVACKREDLTRIRDMCTRFAKQAGGGESLLFRIDRDDSGVGTHILRQNLVNFFTHDFKRDEGQALSQVEMTKQTRLPRLRDIVVRLKEPSFRTTTPDAIFSSRNMHLPGCDLDELANEFRDLNPDQQTAVMKVMGAEDYSLIQGLPGTGKTSTLTFLARLLAAHGKRVLITSYTHAAVDNVLLKLIDKGVACTEGTDLPAVVRIGKRSSCLADVHPFLATEIAARLDNFMLTQESLDEPSGIAGIYSQFESSQNLGGPSAETLSKVISSARIICMSALSVPRSAVLVREHFDVVIVDEAGQISQPAILGVLMAADSFVLVGDHKQLPPLVISDIAESGGYGVSLMKALAEKHPDCITPLTYQYRMNEAICRLSGEAVYGGRLKCGNNGIRHRTLVLPHFYPSRLPQVIAKQDYAWLKTVVDPKTAVLFVDTDNIKKNPRSLNQMPGRQETRNMQDGIEPLEESRGGRADGAVINNAEAALVKIVLEGLFAAGLDASSVGVICPFTAQVRVLNDSPFIATWKKKGLEVSTIDRYQGRDKSVIILSFVRSNPSGKTGRLLGDIRRLNVAMTRAKCKQIMVGSYTTLRAGSVPLRPILARMNKRGQRLLLPENGLKCYKIPD